MVIGLMFVGCGSSDTEEVEENVQQTQLSDEAASTEEASAVEETIDVDTEIDDASQSEDSTQKELTDDMASEAIWKYITTEENPGLEDYDGEAPVYCIVTSEEGADEIVVDFRSYTGSHEYFYIDRATGDTHSTQYVPGIIDEEEDTGLRFNVWDYVE